MARPEPTVIHSIELGDGSTWSILAADAFYAITYKQRPIGIRVHKASLTNNSLLYKKMTYTNLGNALAQVRKLNHKFKCDDFDVMEIT
jgi:hypothetical protein